MRTPIIAGNWKMNTTLNEAIALISRLRPRLEHMRGVEMVLCPPFISLIVVRELLKGSPIKLGAQNVYYLEKGAFTGEVSALMLSDLCQYVIIGHSERRQYMKESDDIINRKVGAAQKAGLKPILCVGENLAENEAGQAEQVIGGQLRASLVNIESIEGLVVAYEPVWAIGTGKAASGPQANGTIGSIKAMLAKSYGEAAEKAPVLYGGSVTGDNIAEFIRQPEIDGALVGGASLKPEQFIDIVRQTTELKA
jgi:triosephosphate isomerase